MGDWVRICLDRARVQSKVPLTFTLKKRVNSGTSTLVMSAGACTPTCHVNLELANSLGENYRWNEKVLMLFSSSVAPPAFTRSDQKKKAD